VGKKINLYIITEYRYTDIGGSGTRIATWEKALKIEGC